MQNISGDGFGAAWLCFMPLACFLHPPPITSRSVTFSKNLESHLFSDHFIPSASSSQVISALEAISVMLVFGAFRVC